MQAENKRIAEIHEHNNLLGRELELVLGKMKISESALNDSNKLNLQLSDTIKLMQGKLDSIEYELDKRTRASISKIEKAHAVELDRLKNELEHVAKNLATVTAELDQQKAETETFKSENSALLHKLYHELERKKKDLNEAILAAATIEKEKEGLENLVARTEKALKESLTLNEESEATIANLKAALKLESSKLCEATAIRKQLEKHYLRQIEDLLSNRPVVSSQVRCSRFCGKVPSTCNFLTGPPNSKLLFYLDRSVISFFCSMNRRTAKVTADGHLVCWLERTPWKMHSCCHRPAQENAKLL